MKMANRQTEVVNHRYCAHAQGKVRLKTRFVFPAGIMPDQPARITARHCSHYFDCNLQDKSACTFSVVETRAEIAGDYT